jgi:hypothetical protein
VHCECDRDEDAQREGGDQQRHDALRDEDAQREVVRVRELLADFSKHRVVEQALEIRGAPLVEDQREEEHEQNRFAGRDARIGLQEVGRMRGLLMPESSHAAQPC